MMSQQFSQSLSDRLPSLVPGFSQPPFTTYLTQQQQQQQQQPMMVQPTAYMPLYYHHNMNEQSNAIQRFDALQQQYHALKSQAELVLGNSASSQRVMSPTVVTTNGPSVMGQQVTDTTTNKTTATGLMLPPPRRVAPPAILITSPCCGSKPAWSSDNRTWIFLKMDIAQLCADTIPEAARFLNIGCTSREETRWGPRTALGSKMGSTATDENNHNEHKTIVKIFHANQWHNHKSVSTTPNQRNERAVPVEKQNDTMFINPALSFFFPTYTDDEGSFSWSPRECNSISVFLCSLASRFMTQTESGRTFEGRATFQYFWNALFMCARHNEIMRASCRQNNHKNVSVSTMLARHSDKKRRKHDTRRKVSDVDDHDYLEEDSDSMDTTA